MRNFIGVLDTTKPAPEMIAKSKAEYIEIIKAAFELGYNSRHETKEKNLKSILVLIGE